MDSYKILRASILSVLLFSIISFMVALQGSDAPVHKLKPLISIIWTVLIFVLLSRTSQKNNYKSTLTGLSWYAFFSLLISGGFSYALMTSVFSGDFFFLPYISIVYACFAYDFRIIGFLKNIALLCAVLYMAVILAFRDTLIQVNALSVIADLAEEGLSLDTITKSFCYASGLFFLLTPAMKKKHSIIIMVAFAVSLIISLFLARRNLIVSSLLYCLFAFIIYFRNRENKSLFLKIIAYAISAVVLYYIVELAISIFSGQNDSDFFSNLVRRVDADSRSHVLIPFYDYMNENPLYWIFGHGMNARYYSDLGWRSVIETGYLQIIMKTGLIGLCAYFIILFKSILKSYKGNLLLQASCAYLLVAMLETIYAGVPSFMISWIVIWICVGICNNSEISSMSNSEIKDLLCR